MTMFFHVPFVIQPEPVLDVRALFNFTSIASPKLRDHILNLYRHLIYMMLFTIFAEYLRGIISTFSIHYRGSWLGLLALLPLILVNLLWCQRNFSYLRWGLLYVFAFLKGLSLSNLLEFAHLNAPNLLPELLVSKLLIYLSFLLATYFAKHRSTIYFFALCSSACSCFIFIWIYSTSMCYNMGVPSSSSSSSFSIISTSCSVLWFSSYTLVRCFPIKLYLSLLCFAICLIYETQWMIVKYTAKSETILKKETKHEVSSSSSTTTFDVLTDLSEFYLNFIHHLLAMVIWFSKKHVFKRIKAGAIAVATTSATASTSTSISSSAAPVAISTSLN